MDVSTFRSILPAFSDRQAYPDAMIQFNIDLAANSLLPRVWGDRLEAGILYYAAHFIAVSGPAPKPGVAGGASGSLLGTGLAASKSVGGVSIAYDTTTGQTDGGGSFNLTRWGQEFLSLRDSVAMGATQL